MITIPGRIPIHIHPIFWLLVLAMGWINSQTIIGTLIWAAVIFVSVLIHEFGHALTAVFFKQRAQIDLVAFGGLTSRSGKKIKLWQEFLIVLNGPLAGFALCALVYPLYLHVSLETLEVWEYAVAVAVYVNLFWTLVNLMPIYPLDGGHLLRIILEGSFGIRGVQIALFFSMVLAGGLALLAFSIGWILLGAIFFLFAFDSYRGWNESRRMTTSDRDEKVQDILMDAEKALLSGNKALAEQKLKEIYVNTDRGVVHYNSAVYLANLYFSQGRYDEAYKILQPEKDILEETTLPLYHQLAWKTGHFDEAISLSNQTYQVRPHYQTALINAFLNAEKKDVQAAVGWLKRSIGDGLPDIKTTLEHPSFNPIRNEPEFIRLFQNLSS